MGFEANCLPTAIGSVPHKDVDSALGEILTYFDHIPFWPQLPNTSFKENMYVQFAEGLPGAVVDLANEKVFFDTSQDLTPGLEKLFEAYLSGNTDAFALREESAQGFYAFLEALKTGLPDIELLKGHITGPISLGLAVLDQDRKPSLYNDEVREAIVKSLGMSIRWQEERMRAARPGVETLMFVDEPYLVSYGSAYVSLTREDIVAMIDEVVSAAEGLVGVHCCGNTDWSILMETSIDLISFDAYDYAESLALYADQVKAFLERGGILAWGAIPSGLPSPDQIEKESVPTLLKRLEGAMGLLVEKGIDKETLVRQALITPSCGTASMSVENAKRSFACARVVSDAMREAYLGIPYVPF